MNSIFHKIGPGVYFMLDDFLKMVGGRKVIQGGEESWNFGVTPTPELLEERIQAKPSLYTRFPKLKGKWDGKSTINHLDAATKILGDKAIDLIQYQPRGTCGGRAGSATGDLIQCILMAMGKRATFRRISHAAVYYAARKKYNMIGGNWMDEDNDGVASGSVPEALATVAGFVGRDEDTDLNWYGKGSDDLACQLGAGMHKDIAEQIIALGADNFITEWSPVYSAAELADGIAAGGIGIGSDSQGFSMSRDRYGFCSASRQRWNHYQVRVSVGKDQWGGHKGFGYFQSWGKDTPSGPLLPGHWGNCFGVDFDLQNRIIQSGKWAVVFGFPLFDLQEDKVNVDWMVS